MRARLNLKHHAPLRDRVVSSSTLRARAREELFAMVHRGFKVTGGDPRVLADEPREVLYRASRGDPSHAVHLLNVALVEAHRQEQSIVDEQDMHAACDELELIKPQGNRIL